MSFSVWLQSTPTVILEPLKIKSLTVSIVSPSICHEVMGQDATSEGRQNENYNHRKLIKLITWTTALSNSVKLSHDVWGHPRQEGHGGEV